jgi:hypothetical protein
MIYVKISPPRSRKSEASPGHLGSHPGGASSEESGHPFVDGADILSFRLNNWLRYSVNVFATKGRNVLWTGCLP